MYVLFDQGLCLSSNCDTGSNESVILWKWPRSDPILIAYIRGVFRLKNVSFYTPPHDSGGVLWFHDGCPCVHLSVNRTTVFHFWMTTLENGFSPNGMCIDIVEIWFWIANGQILTASSARDTSIFSFPDDNLSKCQGILAKVGTRIDIKEIWFGIANGHFNNFLTVICPWHDNGRVSLFYLFISAWKCMLWVLIKSTLPRHC